MLYDPMSYYPSDPAFPNARMTVENQYLSDAVYPEVAAKTAIACTDAVLVVKDAAGEVRPELFLGKRNIYPMKGIWVIGGRIFFNDLTPAHSVQRGVQRETGINFDLDRFLPLVTNFYAWGKVAQGDFPGKNVALTYLLVISGSEAAQVSAALLKSEYEANFGLQGFTRERLVRENCHPMLIGLHDRIFPTEEARAEAVRRAGLPLWER